ncbi:exopolysaccharide biosynthesis protein [Aliihoeflea aestuarii]|uniref:exopolysaccharide biosynthesis protein n=1 Tax=Aliihoeflea aestuarii TaxID=453840 RepID=UPI0020947014|nr:exopolysaccharide biosynthesis protein [Aliihoeflea aestuarii]MCO6393185.1 exopolysaccharide biosynthesis protein [Aliihoeflea aestuarii]
MTKADMLEERNLNSMEAVVDLMAEVGSEDRVCVGDIVDDIDGDAFAPLMLFPALLAVTPASGIPGMTATCGLIIALVAVQIVLRRKAVWLPGFLRRRSISRARLQTARDWLAKPARAIDKVTGKRLAFLVRPPFDIGAALICMCIGLTMPFMEFVPFSGTMAGIAVSLIALALVTEDGVLAVLGTGFLATVSYIGWSAVT